MTALPDPIISTPEPATEPTETPEPRGSHLRVVKSSDRPSDNEQPKRPVGIIQRIFGGGKWRKIGSGKSYKKGVKLFTGPTEGLRTSLDKLRTKGRSQFPYFKEKDVEMIEKVIGRELRSLPTYLANGELPRRSVTRIYRALAREGVVEHNKLSLKKRRKIIAPILAQMRQPATPDGPKHATQNLSPRDKITHSAVANSESQNPGLRMIHSSNEIPKQKGRANLRVVDENYDPKIENEITESKIQGNQPGQQLSSPNDLKRCEAAIEAAKRL